MSTIQSIKQHAQAPLLSPKEVLQDVQDYPTPYMTLDINSVTHNAQKFKKLLPSVEIHYAIKANSDAKVIDALQGIVRGFDVASVGEVRRLIELGISPDRILYSNPVKVPTHIAEAYDLGVRYFAFDSLAEIEKLAKYAPGSNVYLRLKVSDYGSKFPLSSKFGIDARYAADYCSMATDFGLKVKGVTFHVGSQSENTKSWEHAIKTAGRVITTLRSRGMSIEFLNLGGGFPADYGDPAPSLQEVAKVINDALKAYIPEDMRIIAEPGRYMVANVATITASVIGRENRSGVEWLYLDMGTFQGLMEPLEMPNLRYPIKTNKNPRGSKRAFVLSGPSCDAFDTLGSDYMLPADINVGDKITICSVGAYSLVYASNFNGFEPPKVYYQ